jgi:hypothetical protein
MNTKIKVFMQQLNRKQDTSDLHRNDDDDVYLDIEGC